MKSRLSTLALLSILGLAVTSSVRANVSLDARSVETPNAPPNLDAQRELINRRHEAWKQAREIWERDLKEKKAERDRVMREGDADAHLKDAREAGLKVVERGLKNGIPEALSGKRDKAAITAAKMLRDLDKAKKAESKAIDAVVNSKELGAQIDKAKKDIARLEKDIEIATKQMQQNEAELRANSAAMTAAFNGWVNDALARVAAAHQRHEARVVQERAQAERARREADQKAQRDQDRAREPRGASRDPNEPRGSSAEPKAKEPKEPKSPEPKDKSKEPKEPKGPTIRGPG